MRPFNRQLRTLAGLLFFILLANPWHAVRAATCTVTSPTLAFGAYDAVAGTAVTSSAAMTISCTGPGHKNHAVTIALDAGAHSGGSFNPRAMQNTNATGTLSYNLFINTTYITANVWGDGTAGTQTVTATTNTSNPATASATVNGEIPSSQDPFGVCPSTPCSYSDSVIITITF